LVLPRRSWPIPRSGGPVEPVEEGRLRATLDAVSETTVLAPPPYGGGPCETWKGF
jgi:hypothetical protein